MRSSALHRPRRSVLPAVAVLAAALLAGASGQAGAAAPAPSGPQAASALRDVMAIGNGQGGTVSFIDGATLANLGSINVVPDLQQRLDGMNLAEKTCYNTVIAAQGYRKLVDDMAVSPDGGTLYVSRGVLADVVAFDIASRKMLWRHKTDGCMSDHAALSADGTKFIVSETTASKAEVLDTATGNLVTTFDTGTYPHANDYSPDGRLLYNSSIGVTSLPKSLNVAKGVKAVTAVDATTFKPVRTYLFDYGVRPAVFTSDNKYMYAQLSYLNGFIEYDLQAGKITRTVQMPFSSQAAGMNADDYPQNSAHHGMAMNGAETKLCDAGTIDDYVAIISRPGLTTDGTVSYDTGSLPYWTQTSSDGQRCFVSLAEKNQVSVVDYGTAKEVARVPVGNFPQRERTARLNAAALASLDRSNG